MASSKAHIVVAMGAFHIPYHWRFLKASLEDAGYDVTITNLVSTVTSGSQPVTDAMAKNIAAIRSAVTKPIVDGKDVVVIAHSAAGAPASAALEGLAKDEAEPGVLRIVYLSAFLVEPGISILDKVQGNEAPFVEIRDGLQIVRDAKNVFYNDVSDAIADDAVKYICPNSLNLVETPINYVAWTEIPSIYIICEKDNAITPAVAEWLISSCQVPCEVFRIDASHSPFLSMPERLAAIVRYAAGEKDVDLEGVKFDKIDSSVEREAGWSSANKANIDVKW